MSCDAPDRIYAQYRNSPKAVEWLNIVPNIAGELCQAFEDIRTSYDLEAATSDELDTIGDIVVIDRGVIANIVFPVQEFNADGENEFGDTDVSFSPISADQDAELSDEYFRTLIKSKIVKNNAPATSDDIIESLSIIIPNANIIVVNDNEDMSFSITFFGSLTDVQRELLNIGNIVPKPQGVRFVGYVENVGIAEFNSDGQFEFGDNTAEFSGFTGD